MEFLSSDKILKVMAVTRFHFIAGMPTAGADVLTGILDQNPAFTARSGNSAAAVFKDLAAACADPDTSFGQLDSDSKTALMRGALDAVYHARPLASVVFDNNPAWMGLTYHVSLLMPLSRFIFVVRDPASIAADLARDSGHATPPADLLGDEGEIGTALTYLQAILSGPNAERVILIDHDRLMSDPVAVLDVLYRFLREPLVEHDVSACQGTPGRQLIEPRGLRRIVSMSAPTRYRGGAERKLPIWRRMRGSDAVMVLAGT